MRPQTGREEGFEAPALTPARKARPRVLVLDEEIPLPANTGKRIRTLHLLRRLAPRFQIDLVVHENGATAERIAALREDGVEVHVARSRLWAKKGAAFYFRLLWSLFSSFPYSVYSHRKRAYRERVDRLLAEFRYDLIHVEWVPYAVYRESWRVPCVVAAHNVETDLWSRLAQADSSPARRWFLGLQARRMARFERISFAGAAFATAVSAEDARRIEGWGCARVALVPNGVDLEGCPFLPEEAVEPERVLFIGALDWRPNVDGIHWFLREVHPRLKERVACKLWLVGRNPPRWLLDPKNVPPGVEVVGEVPDVRPFLERSAVSIVPLRAGGGSRLKILEAFAHGRPVVSTTVGAEGLTAVNGRDLLLADEPVAFAEAIARLLADAARRRELAAAGRRLVEAEYGWQRIAEIQAKLWSEAIATGSAIPR
jgi:glycosyltransferase involved in cell wall biosynthesis